MRISPRFRWALAGKGLLLLALVAAFASIAVASGPCVAAIAGLIGCFLAWASSLAFIDAIRGHAFRESGAKPLASRWTGRSLRTPSGRFVEFVLWNPWGPLDRDARYTVTYGSRSGVIVERPVREART